LAACGATAALLLVARRSRGGLPLVDSMLHLLAGGLAGFLAIAFYPAWPILAAIIGMLTIRAGRAGRWTDIGMLATGFGATWTALLGASLIRQRLDPAIWPPDTPIPIAVGVALLIFGLVVAAGAEGDITRPR
jgi:hypothetical protein